MVVSIFRAMLRSKSVLDYFTFQESPIDLAYIGKTLFACSQLDHRRQHGENMNVHVTTFTFYAGRARFDPIVGSALSFGYVMERNNIRLIEHEPTIYGDPVTQQQRHISQIYSVSTYQRIHIYHL